MSFVLKKFYESFSTEQEDLFNCANGKVFLLKWNVHVPVETTKPFQYPTLYMAAAESPTQSCNQYCILSRS